MNVLRLPGPDPNICACGGPMSPPIKGRQTGLWIRTCRECFKATATTDAPPANVEFRQSWLPTPGPMFSGIETISRGKPFARVGTVASAYDARMRQAGEREPGEDD